MATIEQSETDGVWLLTVGGRMGWADFDAVVPRMKRTLRSNQPLRLVVDYHNATGMSAGGWLREAVELVRLFPLRKARGRCAVLTAKNFTDRFLRVEDWFQPNLETRFFDPDDRSEAIAWTAAAR